MRILSYQELAEIESLLCWLRDDLRQRQTLEENDVISEEIETRFRQTARALDLVKHCRD